MVFKVKKMTEEMLNGDKFRERCKENSPYKNLSDKEILDFLNRTLSETIKEHRNLEFSEGWGINNEV